MFKFQKSAAEKLGKFIKIYKHDFEEYSIDDKKEIISLIKSGIGLNAQPVDDSNILIGHSKLGGKPDLPANKEWPMADGQHMIFCGQYNLEECAKYDFNKQLPPDGLFSVFVTQDFLNFEFNHFTVNNLQRKEYPTNFDSEHFTNSHRIAFFELPTLPTIQIEHLTDKYDDIHFLLLDEYQWFIQELTSGIYNNHQILGHERPIQYSTKHVFALQELGLTANSDIAHLKAHESEMWAIAKEYEILLQIDFDVHYSGTDFHSILGDGTLYFGIRSEDLKQGNFDNVKMEYQCT